MAERVLLVVEIAGTWMEPVAVAVEMRTCDCKPVKPVENQCMKVVKLKSVR